MNQKLLVLGALPSELGGSYTTGVTNVISSLVPFFSKVYQTSVFATNVRMKGIKLWISWPNNDFIRIYGYTYLKLIWLFLKEIFLHPFKSYREMIEYRQVYGASPLRMFLYQVNLSNVLLDFTPDILHIHGLLLESVVKNTGYSGLKITTLHGIFSEDHNAIEFNKSKGFDIKKLYYESAKLINNLTCLTSEMLKQSKQILKINNIPMRIISNGVNLKRFRFQESVRQEYRHSYNINTDEIIFLSVSSLTKRKGHLDFIRFLHRTKLSGKYWIIGDGPEFNILKQEIKRLDLEDKVNLIGFIPNNQLYNFYSSADIFVLPSSAEGQALCILEAAATGLKILVNKRIKGTLELPKEISKYIYYLDIDMPSTLDDFTYWLNEIINREEITTAMQCFSWKVIANQYIDFFKKIK